MVGNWYLDFRDAIRVLNFLKFKSIIFESYPPFYDNEPMGIYKKIVSGIIEFPRFFDVKVKDLIRKLLNPDINLRLGISDVTKL